MKLYRTHIHSNFAVPGAKAIWSASKADASKDRGTLAEKYGLKRTQVYSHEHDIPTNKQGLLDWLNENAV